MGRRRAALIATLATLPVLVLAAVVLVAIGGKDTAGGGNGNSRSVIQASAPTHATTESAPCTKLLEALPVALKALQPRVVHTKPATPFVVAWGDPAIVLRCGVAKPKAFTARAEDQLFSAAGADGAFYWVDRDGDANVYTAVDRQAYVSFTVPSKYQGSDYLPPLNAAVLKAMPEAVCSTTASAAVKTLCSRRAN